MLAAVEVLIAIGAAVAQGLTVNDAIGSYLVTNMAMGSGFAACGAILAVHRTRNPVGWLLLAAGVAHLTTAASGAVAGWGAAQGLPEPVLRVLVTVFLTAWPWGICMLLPLALQLFPDGRPVSPRWRWLLWLTVVLGISFTAAMGTDPAPMTLGDRDIRSYLVLPLYDSLAPLWFLANMAPLVGLLAATAGLIVRARRGDEQLRRQLLWLVLAVIAAVAVNLPRFIVGDGPILLLLTVPLVPIAITIAILRYQLLDIRLVVSRALLYLTLTLAVIGAYVLLVAAVDALLRGAGAPVIATLLIALAFNPARVWLQRRVDMLLYGSRSDPVAAVSRVGARLAADDLAGVLEGIREALRLPFAALRRDGRELAAVGSPPAVLHAVPLLFHGGRIGDLVVGARSGERTLSPADLSVVDLLAAPLAAALHATALAVQVQQSRERIVSAREEERRRLHRDLHDGLGSTLTGAAFKADAAHNLATSAPAQAEEIVAGLRHDIRSAIEDVRRIVYGLRPPALDELGLIGALHRHCEALPLPVIIDAPESLPPLPAAVEVAAYRIATEAITNVIRHAGASSVRVGVAMDSGLRLSIEDDGPTDAPWAPGVGLTSIRERAAELGGSCEAGPTGDGGRVLALLPLKVPT